MSVQTSYPTGFEPAVEGQQANNASQDLTVRSAEGEIPFGRAVVRGTADRQAKLVSGSSDKFLGVSLRIVGVENPLGGELTKYDDKEPASVLRKGYVWVVTEQAVVPGDDVYYRHTAPGSEKLGQFRKDADTSNATQLANATFETTAEAGKLAVIRIA